MTTPSSDTISNGGVFQNSIYIGINLQNILYGVELVLYFKTIHIVLTNKGARRKSNMFYALFSSVMLFSVTVWVATLAIFGEKMWLLDSDFPGGPDAYWRENISIWYMDFGTTVIVVLQLMTDALMIYRCRIIWNSYCVVIIPIILWLATLVLGILFDWTSSSPGADYFNGLASQLCLAYYAVSVFLNTTLTCMICYRMVCHGSRIQKHLGHEYASLYFTVITILVESVSPYTLSGIAFLVSLGIGSRTSVVFLCVYFMMMCISPQMLILRVIVGRALNNDTSKRPRSTIKFSPEGMSGSQRFDSNGARVHLETLSDVHPPDGHNKV